jgi:hypothetical protein
MVRNKRRPLPPPVASMDAIWSDAEKAAIQHMMRYSFIGDAEKVSSELRSFINTTKVDEVMVASHLYHLQDKIHCYELIAPLFKRRAV